MYFVEHPTLYHYTTRKRASSIARGGIVSSGVSIDKHSIFECVWLTKNPLFYEQHWASSPLRSGVRFTVNIGGIDDRLYHWNSFKTELGLDKSPFSDDPLILLPEETTDEWFIFLGDILLDWVTGATKRESSSLPGVPKT